MKNRILYLGILSLLFVSELIGLTGSQTFLSNPIIFWSGTPERVALNRVPRNDCFSFFQITPLGGQSASKHVLMGAFMPYNKTSIFVAEDGADGAEKRDVAAINLNIATQNDTFRSLATFLGKQSIGGAGLVYRQQFAPHWWVEVAAPILRVQNEVTIEEDVFDDGGGVLDEKGLDGAPYVANVKEAFAQSTWKFGRVVSGRKLSKTGIGDVEFKVGLHSLHEDYLAIIGYVGAVLPTGGKPTGKFMFEPMIGNNGHYGLMYGTMTCLDFWRRDDHILALAFSFDTRYLFHNFQTRSFDLNDKQFSRYIATYKDAAEAEAAADTLDINGGTSGINVFTQKVKVSPRFTTLVSTAFLYDYKSFEAELGYMLSIRQSENVEIIWEKTPAVKDVGGLGNTNRARTIKDNFGASFSPVSEYQPLAARDLNLSSAAQPVQWGSTVYAALGYYVRDCDHPVLVGLGGSYEFNMENIFDRWLIWANLAISY